ncbi:MAG: MFS transporter [Opitutaceae bacterium]|jgi:OPA family glycerol-3-phosphate transporter-like MFS transporter/OPA family sugar phosphate sensor protein UhpC-like MFS transporter|nr:MFS transporter [Opitutaceae bacterium]
MTSTTDTSESQSRRFRYWQWRTIIATMIGYSLFYFVRTNASVATRVMLEDESLGVNKAQLGFIFTTLFGVVYAISKFTNGFIGDRVNSRAFMVTGLLLAAVCNIVFGFTSALWMFGLVWLFNGWFQGMGFPPCARLITFWVPPNELATKMSVWNASHSIGAGLVLLICGYIAAHLGVEQTGVAAWRWCFFIPSGIAIVGAAGLWFALRDTPSSVGLPELSNAGKKQTNEDSAEFRRFLRERVFFNPVVWIVGAGQFFVYVMRSAILFWGPTFLGQQYDLDIKSSVWMTAGFEISGIAGMLLAGWMSDRFFGGRAARVCVVCMLLATVAVLLFWLLPLPPLAMSVLLMAAGFCIYGPQALGGVITANIVTRRAAATAIGFTALFAYASNFVSGWGIGLLAEKCGWPVVFGALCVVGLAGAIVFALLWKTKPDGYDDNA